MKYLRILLLVLALPMAGCVSISGMFGWTDPATGVTAGITVGNGASTKAIKPLAK